MSPPSRRDTLRLAGLAGVSALAGCRSVTPWRGPNEQPPRSVGTSWSPSAKTWRFPHGDLRNTASSPHGVQTAPSVAWQDSFDGGRSTTPTGAIVAATPERVITARRFGSEVQLHAEDATDGTRRWNRWIVYPPDGRTPTFGGLVDGTVYVTDGGTDVVAVDASDGTVRWRRSLYDRVADSVPDKYLSVAGSPAEFAARALATPEIVYVQSSYGVHGIAPRDGTEQWRLYLGAHHDADALEEPRGLAVADRRIWAVYGGTVQSLFTIELSDGQPEIERVPSPLQSPSRPVVPGYRDAVFTHDIVWASKPQETLAVGTTDERAEWECPGHTGSGGVAYSSLATDGERVFVCVSHEQQDRLLVSALHASTGKLDWLFREPLADRDASPSDSGEFRLCRPAVTGNCLVVGYGTLPETAVGRGEIVAISRTDGRVCWRISLRLAPRSVSMTSARLFVTGRQGGVVALTGGLV